MPDNPKTSDDSRPRYVLPLLILGGVIAVCGVILAFICPTYSSATTALTAIGVAMASGGLLFWRSELAKKQLDKSQTQIKQMQFSTRNQTWKGSIELLANDKSAAARIGGVESLSQVTIENPKHYGKVATRILQDFIRQRLQILNEKTFIGDVPDGVVFSVDRKIIETPYEIYHAIRKLSGIYEEYKNDKSKCDLMDYNFSHLKIGGKYAKAGEQLSKLFKDFLLNKSNFISANLEELEIMNTEFFKCDFSLCTFNDVSFKQVVSKDCPFISAQFLNCDLIKVRFERCPLGEAKFGGNILAKISNLKDTTFYRCDLTNTEFSGTKGLTEKSFRNCYYYHPPGYTEINKPKLPEGISPDIIEAKESSTQPF